MPVSECSIEEWEGFLHNHQECINAQRKPENPIKHFEMEESDEEPFSPQNWKAVFPDYSLAHWKALFTDYSLPESPVKHWEMEESDEEPFSRSIKCMEYELWKDDESIECMEDKLWWDEKYVVDFKLNESPPSKLQNFPNIK